MASPASSSGRGEKAGKRKQIELVCLDQEDEVITIKEELSAAVDPEMMQRHFEDLVIPVTERKKPKIDSPGSSSVANDMDKSIEVVEKEEDKSKRTPITLKFPSPPPVEDSSDSGENVVETPQPATITFQDDAGNVIEVPVRPPRTEAELLSGYEDYKRLTFRKRVARNELNAEIAALDRIGKAILTELQDRFNYKK